MGSSSFGLRYWILDGKQPVRATLDEWRDWFERGDRVVHRTQIGEVTVSTVFIGMDQQLFETMVFGGEDDGYQQRNFTWEGAEICHILTVSEIAAGKRVGSE